MSDAQASMPALAIMLVCLAATLFMTGVIWVIQLVHYPLFAQVGEADFLGYHASHSSRITLLVGLPMLAELLTALLLLFVRPPGFPAWLAVAGCVLVLVIWGSTAALQVPSHNQLASASAGDRLATVGALVTMNWIRTLAWTARSALMLWATALLIAR